MKSLNKKAKSTGRKCSICSHDDVKKINSLINEGTSFRRISSHFGMADRSVSRHAENCLNLEIAMLLKEKRIENAIDHQQEITEQLEFAKALRLAARQYLSDPDTGELTLIPRAREITVIFEDYDDLNRQNEPKKKREKLDTLLEKLENVRRFHTQLLRADVERILENADKEVKEKVSTLFDNYHTDFVEVTKTEIKHVDIRQYALNAITIVDLVLDKVAKVKGLYQADKPNDTTIENAVRGFQWWLEDNPGATPEEKDIWIKRFAVGAKLPPAEFIKHIETVQ